MGQREIYDLSNMASISSYVDITLLASNRKILLILKMKVILSFITLVLFFEVAIAKPNKQIPSCGQEVRRTVPGHEGTAEAWSKVVKWPVVTVTKEK